MAIFCQALTYLVHSENLLCSRTNTFKDYCLCFWSSDKFWKCPLKWWPVIDANPTLLQLDSRSCSFLLCSNVFLKILDMTLQITEKPCWENHKFHAFWIKFRSHTWRWIFLSVLSQANFLIPNSIHKAQVKKVH
jgi:hypothetical protein